MNSARWNWIVLEVVAGLCLLIGTFGIFAGLLSVTFGPIAFLGMAVFFLIAGLIIRRMYRAYEAEVLPLAAADLEAERQPHDGP